MTPPVLNQAAWVQRAQALQLGNYAPAPIVLTEGRGSEVWDHAGRRYLDFAGGIAVLSVGHSHPRLSDAISAQAQRLMHVSNLFYNDRAIALAETLTAVSGYARVYFCNSGAEANETLIKLARRWHHDQGRPERTRIVAAHGSFHGRTLGALSVTGQSKYHHGFGPLLPDVDFVPFGDVAALEQTLQDRTAALLLEPIQAEGGIIVGSDAYLQAAQALCRARGVLLFFDEVQTGVGRTGRFLAQAHAGVQADACALAKGLESSGLPGATAA
ncbi:MAG: aspartate aminotransferase family protein, partial [Polyangiales bacterium]